MILRNPILCVALAFLGATIATSCATGQQANQGTDGGSGDGSPSCTTCDSDGDGVPDSNDQCPNTPPNSTVNKVGCADSQLTAKLNPNWPPYGMTWTPTGDPGRAGGLTWTYTGIQRGDLFHIYWIVCDDPSDPCGLSLDGPIDVPAEKWVYNATNSDLPNGKLVFTNSTGILLADGTTTPLSGRLTITIVDASNAPIPFATVGSLGVSARNGQYGAEIKGTGFKVTILGEVEDGTTATWTPYLDYYDAAPTVDTGDAGGNVYTSVGGYFYDK